MNGWIVFVALTFASGPALAAAPFCVVTSGQSRCHFYDAQACQQAARAANGICSANPQAGESYTPQPPAVVQIPDAFEAAERGREAGRRERQAREQSELNRLQQEALRQQIAQRETSTDGETLGEVAVSASALHHACSLAQTLLSPAGMRLTTDEGQQALACMMYTYGAHATATLTSGFASPDKLTRFCIPRSDSTGKSLIDALVNVGDQHPEMLSPGVGTQTLLVAAFATLSSCSPTVR